MLSFLANEEVAVWEVVYLGAVKLCGVGEGFPCAGTVFKKDKIDPQIGIVYLEGFGILPVLDHLFQFPCFLIEIKLLLDGEILYYRQTASLKYRHSCSPYTCRSTRQYSSMNRDPVQKDPPLNPGRRAPLLSGSAHVPGTTSTDEEA